jgi:hypothetical protein
VIFVYTTYCSGVEAEADYSKNLKPKPAFTAARGDFRGDSSLCVYSLGLLRYITVKNSHDTYIFMDCFLHRHDGFWKNLPVPEEEIMTSVLAEV